MWPLAYLGWMIVLSLSANQGATDSVSVLLEKGIYTEETVGDLDAAMKIYEQIVTEAQANRRCVAQARFRLAMCHLKKKQQPQATAEFEKLIAEFPDQQELVAQARKHLPAAPFPEIEGCRLKETAKLTLAPPGAGRVTSQPTVSTSIYEDSLLDIAWTVPAEMADKSRAWIVAVRRAEVKETDMAGFSWWATIKDASRRSVRYGDHQVEAPRKAQPLKAGDYVLTVMARETNEIKQAIDNKNVVGVATVKLEVKPMVYTQISINGIEPDGTIKGRSIIHQLNDSTTPLETIGFINSDFVHVTGMTDEDNRPIKLTTEHEGNIYRYKATLNNPVAPGEPVMDASDLTITGLVKPVKDKKDVFEYHMQHSPNSGQTTRRIEIYRLPAGAEVIETTPPTMARRVKDGRTELFVEKMIPAGGSILTSFRYRLTGAAATQAESPALQLKSAPWADGEEMQLRILSMAGAEMGTIIYSSDSTQVGGKPAWRIQSDMVVSIADMLQYTCVVADRDSFAPVTGVTKNSSMGDFKASYAPGEVTVTAKAGGKENTRKVSVDTTAYDNEQVLYLMRRLPLAKGYRARFDIFPIVGGMVMEGQVEVTEKEKIAVPAGTYDCYKIALSVYLQASRVLEHQVWMSADEHQYLVKYDSGNAIMELVKVSTRDKAKPVVFTDPDLKLSLPAPAGWHFYRSPNPPDNRSIVQLLVPEQKAWAVLAASDRPSAAETIRKVAEEKAGTVKGFLKGYTIRPASWAEMKLAGMPAARYEADYQDKGRDMVEYRTYLLGKSAAYWFVLRIEKDKFQEMKPTFDGIMDSFKAQ